MSPKFNFRCPEDLMAQVSARGDQLSDALRQSLERYFRLLEEARAELRELLTGEDLGNIAALTNATWFEARTLEGVLWNAEDALQYEVPYPDALPSLRIKLAGLTLCQHAALVDAAERFWRAVGMGVRVDPATMLEDALWAYLERQKGDAQ